MTKRHASVHRGEILLEECLQTREINQYRSTKKNSVNPRRLNQIIHALNLQARYDLGGREGKTQT